MGPAAIPVALVLAGTATNAYEQNQAAGRQNQIESQSLEQQQDLKNQALGAVNKAVGQVQNSSKQQALLQAQDRANFTKQLIANTQASNAAGAAPTTGAPALPGASKAYTAANATGNSDVATYGNNLADAMAAISGTQRQLQSQGATVQNTANQVSTLSQESAQDSFIKQLQAQGIMENPWIKGLATAAQVAGMGLSSAGLGAGAGAGAGSAYSTAASSAYPWTSGMTKAGTAISAGGTDASLYSAAGAAA